MLKIVKTEDVIRVDQIVTVIYGSPGLGKSTLGFSADAPLTLDFDKGCYRASNRKDSVHIDSWGDITSITVADLEPYNTVIVDTAGRALDFLTVDIIRRNPKHGNGGALTLQGYGVLKSNFTTWLNSLKILGKDVVIIAHSSEDKKGDDIIERLDVQGGSKGEIYKSSDAMGRLSLINGQRTLSFSPTDTAFGKNPGCLPSLSVPDILKDPLFLAKIIQQIKDKLNELSETQQARQKVVAKWDAKFLEVRTPEAFTKLIEEVKKADKDICPILKGNLHKKATEAGMVFDTETSQYIIPMPEKEREAA